MPFGAKPTRTGPAYKLSPKQIETLNYGTPHTPKEVQTIEQRHSFVKNNSQAWAMTSTPNPVVIDAPIPAAMYAFDLFHQGRPSSLETLDRDFNQLLYQRVAAKPSHSEIPDPIQEEFFNFEDGQTFKKQMNRLWSKISKNPSDLNAIYVYGREYPSMDHQDIMYIGSTVNFLKRWANHDIFSWVKNQAINRITIIPIPKLYLSPAFNSLNFETLQKLHQSSSDHLDWDLSRIREVELPKSLPKVMDENWEQKLRVMPNLRAYRCLEQLFNEADDRAIQAVHRARKLPQKEGKSYLRTLKILPNQYLYGSRLDTLERFGEDFYTKLPVLLSKLELKQQPSMQQAISVLQELRTVKVSKELDTLLTCPENEVDGRVRRLRYHPPVVIYAEAG